MEQKKLTVSLVTYNAERYLPYCLESLENQTFKDFSLIVIDNGSSDGTVNFFKEKYPQVKIVTYKENIGFARAHNQAIDWSKSEYVCLLNQDVILEPEYLEKCLKFLDGCPEAAAVSGKILVWDFANNFKTKLIDTLGLRIFKNHRVVERGQGEIDEGQSDEVKEVFGVSGALPIFRKSALEKIQVKVGNLHNEYFDELFGSYKEDVDLAYRLRLAGYSAWYLPEAIAFHSRTASGSADLSDKATRQGRKKKNKMIKINSYKNHLLALFKNEFPSNLRKFFFYIYWYEFKKLVYILLFEQATLKGLSGYFHQRAKMKEKKKYIIKEIRKITSEDLAKWYESR